MEARSKMVGTGVLSRLTRQLGEPLVEFRPIGITIPPLATVGMVARRDGWRRRTYWLIYYPGGWWKEGSPKVIDQVCVGRDFC